MITQALKQAIAESGLTLYRIAKDAPVSYAILHTFVNGKRDIRLGTADKIARAVGLEFKPPKRVRRKVSGRTRKVGDA